VVLFVGVAARNRAEAYALAHGSGAAQGGEADRKPAHPAKEAGSGVSGYESIILWPAPEKKQIFAPLPAWSLSLAEQAAKPLVIRFDGVYWYFQEPEKRPGPHAHQAHGNPVALDIEARNFAPLQMEAHQNLGSPIRLTRCREIQVAIENRNGGPGGLSLGVLLTDSASRGKPTLSLGQQPVASSLPGEFLNKPAAVSQTLRFRVPASARIRKFDEITVLFQPDGQDFKVGPRIAIREFQLIPR